MEKYIRDTRDHYQIRAEVYDQTYGSEDRIKYYDAFIRFLNGKRILDVGCGAGRDLAYFSDKGFALTGVDITPSFIKMARKNASSANIIEMDFCHLSFQPGSFDGIWSCLSLQHIKKVDHSRILSDFHNILSDHGIIFIRMMLGDGYRYVYSEASKKQRYFAFYKELELNQLLVDSGFSIQYSDIQKDEDPNNINIIALKA